MKSMAKGLLVGKGNRGMGRPRRSAFLYWQGWYSLQCLATSLEIISHQYRSRTQSNVAINGMWLPGTEESWRAWSTNDRRILGRSTGHEKYCVYACDLVISWIDIALPHWCKNYLQTVEFHHSNGERSLGSLRSWITGRTRYVDELVSVPDSTRRKLRLYLWRDRDNFLLTLTHPNKA